MLPLWASLLGNTVPWSLGFMMFHVLLHPFGSQAVYSGSSVLQFCFTSCCSNNSLFTVSVHLTIVIQLFVQSPNFNLPPLNISYPSRPPSLNSTSWFGLWVSSRQERGSGWELASHFRIAVPTLSNITLYKRSICLISVSKNGHTSGDRPHTRVAFILR